MEKTGTISTSSDDARAEAGETKLEQCAESISDVAPNARLHLSKYARGRYAIVNMQGLKMGCFDDEPGDSEDGR